MKRFGPACLAILILCALMCACSPKESLASYTVSDAQALVNAGVCDGEMEPVDAFIVSMLYGIDEGSITECVGYLAIDTSVSADEVTVLVMKDEESAIAAEEACRNRMADQIAACANYCPDQAPRLEKAVILRRGSTVLLAAANPERLPKALEELGLN